MTDRKVLNKYYPPDYDPSKIPKIKKSPRIKKYNIRTMAPFNMKCKTCNSYIYKARKFNSKMQEAEDVKYLGIKHYRFYVKCPNCCAEIVWRTDTERQDYALESGAIRSFEALRTAEELAEKKAEEEAQELENNSMKLMEKRTEQSKREMEMSELIEDIREVNRKQAEFENSHNLIRDFWEKKERDKMKLQQIEDDFITQCLQAKHCGKSIPEIPKIDEKGQFVLPEEEEEKEDFTMNAPANLKHLVTEPEIDDSDLKDSEEQKTKEAESKDETPVQSSSSTVVKSIVTATKKKLPPSFASAKRPLSAKPELKRKISAAETKPPMKTNCLGLAYSDDSGDD